MSASADPNCKECNGTGQGRVTPQGIEPCACVRIEDDAPQMREDDPSVVAQRLAAMEAIGITDAEVEAGAEFHVETDQADSRWQRVTIRMPRVHNLEDLHLHGVEAQWRTMKYYLAASKGVIDMLSATLPLKIVSGLAMHGVAHALDAIGLMLAAIDERRREQKAKKEKMQ